MVKFLNLNNLLIIKKKMNQLSNIKLFYDGLDIKNDNLIQGYTTNPSLLKKHINYNSNSYEKISKLFLEKIDNLPISFEVLSNDNKNMINEAKIISSWGDNIYIKIPIIDINGNYNINTIQSLLNENININITCVFTKNQINMIQKLIIHKNNKIIISIFSGRIADTGKNPMDLCIYTKNLFQKDNNIEILWASVREIYNIFQAIESKCDIITLPENIYQKLNCIDKNLTEFSKETVQQFITDGKSLIL